MFNHQNHWKIRGTEKNEQSPETLESRKTTHHWTNEQSIEPLEKYNGIGTIWKIRDSDPE